MQQEGGPGPQVAAEEGVKATHPGPHFLQPSLHPMIPTAVPSAHPEAWPSPAPGPQASEGSEASTLGRTDHTPRALSRPPHCLSRLLAS